MYRVELLGFGYVNEDGVGEEVTGELSADAMESANGLLLTCRSSGSVAAARHLSAASSRCCCLAGHHCRRAHA